MEEIFLCCEFSFERNEVSPVSECARTVCEKLRSMGYGVFFTSESSPDSGVDGYLRLVSSHLDAARVLILVSAAPDDCADGWIRFEWESFAHEIAGWGPKKLLLSYLAGPPDGYPVHLRKAKSFRWGTELDSLLSAVETFLSEQ